jgi:hypothetical protein
MHSLNSFRMAAIYILLKVMLMAGCCNLFQPVWTSAIHVKIFIYIFLCQVMHVYLHHFLHVNLQVPYQYVVVSTLQAKNHTSTSLIKAYHTGTALQIFTFPLFCNLLII